MLSTMTRYGSHQVPHILSLQPELGGMFADNMDMFSLTMWRLTCRTNYDQAVRSLKRSLSTMLRPFVPTPAALLDVVTRHRSVFGGEFALAFILRDPSILSSYLDIYCADRDFVPLSSSILDGSEFRSVIESHEFIDLGALDALRTLECGILVVHTRWGTTIRVHQSYTSSATAPISHSSSTALSNFVTEFGFGCSHPSLTLRRVAIVADQELPHVSSSDHDLMDRLMRRGISFAFSPIAWSNFPGPFALGGAVSVGPSELPQNTNIDLDGAGSFPDTVPEGPTGSGHVCRCSKPCGTCICAGSPAPGSDAVHDEVPGPPALLQADGLSRGASPSNDRAGSNGASIAASGTVIVPTAEETDVSSGSADPEFESGLFVGPTYYHYDGFSDNIPTQAISVWDIVPVSSIERPLYMGEVVYSGGGRDVNPVVVLPCADPRPLEDGSFPDVAELPNAVGAVVDTGSMRPSSPSLLSPSAVCSSSAVVSAGSCTSTSLSSPSSPNGDILSHDGPMSSGCSYPLHAADAVSPALDTMTAVFTDTNASTPVDGLVVPSPDPGSSSSLSSSTASHAHVDVPAELPHIPSSDDAEYTDSGGDADTLMDFPPPEKCLRHLYLCPSQGRFFGDRGSFVDFFDPLDGQEDLCARNTIAPFGPVVIWRVLSTYNCEKGCDIYDDALDIGIPPTPVILRPSSIDVDTDAD